MDELDTFLETMSSICKEGPFEVALVMDKRQLTIKLRNNVTRMEEDRMIIAVHKMIPLEEGVTSIIKDMYQKAISA